MKNIKKMKKKVDGNKVTDRKVKVPRRKNIEAVGVRYANEYCNNSEIIQQGKEGSSFYEDAEDFVIKDMPKSRWARQGKCGELYGNTYMDEYKEDIKDFLILEEMRV